MTKRTVEISGEDLTLCMKHEQLLVGRQGGEVLAQIPLEDIGALIVDTPTAQYTHQSLIHLLENGGVAVLCGWNHHPVAIVTPLVGHHLQTERLRAQVEATQPTRKRLWARIIQAKIQHQAMACENPEVRAKLQRLRAKVKSGDPNNLEAQAARLYWSVWLGTGSDFHREREGPPPNHFLNYGYMVLRALLARTIAAAGLHPSLALRHCNRYNPFSLVDDVIEPFRPLVDVKARELWRAGKTEIDKETKHELLGILTSTVELDGENLPLLIAAERMAASLAQCLADPSARLAIPTLKLESPPISETQSSNNENP